MSFAVPAFSDVDGDALSYTATLAGRERAALLACL